MKKVVTIGGGTGSNIILSGLKNLPGISISAIVSMADDGGSTGRLRRDLGVLPPGDVGRCLVALSEESEIVRKLMDYRFSQGGLSGHRFRNILLAALEKITGDFSEGIKIASKILRVKGKVLPVTVNKADLCMLFSNGKLLKGESNIDHGNLQSSPIKKIFYKNKVELAKEAKQAILKADYIILSPGDCYTSIIPNLIVEGFRNAIKKSRAKIILPINLMNKRGHTMHFKVSDYVKTIELYLGKPIDFILVNNKAPSKNQIKIYKLKNGDGVLIEDDIKKDPRAIRTPFLSHSFYADDKMDKLEDIRNFIRHDPKKLAKVIAKIINK